MKKIKIYLLTLILTSVFGHSNVLGQEPDISGYIRNYTGMLTTGSNDFSIIQNTLNLDITGSKGNIAFKANPYVYQYFDQDIDFGLREAYLDLYLNNFDIRFGRQQIIWGKADGAFITDIVSPKDLSEFLLPDFEEIRMGVNAIKIDYYLTPLNLYGYQSLQLLNYPIKIQYGFQILWEMILMLVSQKQKKLIAI